MTDQVSDPCKTLLRFRNNEQQSRGTSVYSKTTWKLSNGSTQWKGNVQLVLGYGESTNTFLKCYFFTVIYCITYLFFTLFNKTFQLCILYSVKSMDDVIRKNCEIRKEAVVAYFRSSDSLRISLSEPLRCVYNW